MNDTFPTTYSTFDGYQRLASGSLADAARALKHALDGGAQGPVLIIDDASGRTIDIDTRGTPDEVVARLADHPAFRTTTGAPSDATPDAPESEPRGRGRPKLGVVPREVTLLPRHWEWLATQPGGASVALRKLVEASRRASLNQDRVRQAQERTYHFMQAIAGDLPHFEEATRALFADDQTAFGACIASWPAAVREHALRLAFGE